MFFVKQKGRGSVSYTRSMSRFGRFLPELVFKVVVEEKPFLSFRLSNRSAGVLIMIVGGIIANAILTDENSPHYAGLIVLGIALAVFVLFAVLECLQTQMKIKRAISNYKLTQRIKLLFKA